jgi:tetratricopeptide (TPR) repeat protein
MAKSNLCGFKQRAVSSGFLAIICLFGVVIPVSISCKRTPERRPAPKARPVALCAGGVSEDPPRRELDPGIRAFEAKKYREAQESFTRLAKANPHSGAVLVWLGDALFYDKDKSEEQAAKEAVVAYEESGRLHDAGCILPRRPRYYQLMGLAYAELRLAKAGGPLGLESLERAQKALGTLEAEFPTSAEVPYTQARAACLGAQIAVDGGKEHVAACLERFKKTISISEGYDRPRFLRVHRSTQDWLVRAETQSEFGPLRSNPDYTKFVRATVRAAAE